MQKCIKNHAVSAVYSKVKVYLRKLGVRRKECPEALILLAFLITPSILVRRNGKLGVRKVRELKNADEALKQAALTLEKYRKNKTMVAPEDLQGKYKIPYAKLKKQLADELTAYLKTHCLSGMSGKPVSEAFIEEVNQTYASEHIGEKVGKAAYQDFDLQEIQSIAERFRLRTEEIWRKHFQKEAG